MGKPLESYVSRPGLSFDFYTLEKVRSTEGRSAKYRLCTSHLAPRPFSIKRAMINTLKRSKVRPGGILRELKHLSTWGKEIKPRFPQ